MPKRSRSLVSPMYVRCVVCGRSDVMFGGRSSLSRVIEIASGFTSTLIEFLPVNRHSTGVVPPPTIGSRTVSPGLEYSSMMFLTTSGAQFPLYWGVWDAQFPLRGKLQTVVRSTSKLVGPAVTVPVPLYCLHGRIVLFSIITGSVECSVISSMAGIYWRCEYKGDALR